MTSAPTQSTPAPSGASDAGEIATPAEFWAHALAIEKEAAGRYRELAERMEAEHHYALVPLLRMLAAEEQQHSERLRSNGLTMQLPQVAEDAYRWRASTSPEVAQYDPAQHPPTQQQALAFALANEQRVCAFFDQIAARSPDAEVRELAREFAAAKALHLQVVERLLGLQPAPSASWKRDADSEKPR